MHLSEKSPGCCVSHCCPRPGARVGVSGMLAPWPVRPESTNMITHGDFWGLAGVSRSKNTTAVLRRARTGGRGIVFTPKTSYMCDRLVVISPRTKLAPNWPKLARAASEPGPGDSARRHEPLSRSYLSRFDTTGCVFCRRPAFVAHPALSAPHITARASENCAKTRSHRLTAAKPDDDERSERGKCLRAWIHVGGVFLQVKSATPAVTARF